MQCDGTARIIASVSQAVISAGEINKYWHQISADTSSDDIDSKDKFINRIEELLQY
jgi:hypothetical protein